MQAGEVVVEEPAERFGVSASTIRRDLQHPASAKTIQRTCFGIVGGDGSRVPSRSAN
ncbi:DeoR family transcriptional regulator [Methylobacterium aquaticum]|uniref:DeoR family transcriptional regulator n=1 Tax=Methylobacterium aquaticum TaxID=270351 RepID=UPI00193327E4|nr:DeoR family transcriptional regulator [Methylobacterium aquaticum]QRE72944.1 DeoR family transcriptional regulator [Methylobacterium aquaticum]